MQGAKQIVLELWNGWFTFAGTQFWDNPIASKFKAAFKNYGPDTEFPYYLDGTWDIWDTELGGWQIDTTRPMRIKELQNHSKGGRHGMDAPFAYVIYDTIWATALAFAEMEIGRKNQV